MNYEQRRFIILVIIVSISGFSQGMLLPLISVIFEGDGVSSTLNGLNATGLYINFINIPINRATITFNGRYALYRLCNCIYIWPK